MVKAKREKLRITDELLSQCFENMTPHMERGLKRNLSSTEIGILREGIESAVRNTEGVYDYLEPTRTQGELCAEIDFIRAALREASSRLGPLINDGWFMEALQNGFDSARSNQKHAESLQMHSHYVNWIISFTAAMDTAHRIFDCITLDHLPAGGATTSYRKVPMLSLIEMWYRITGSYPKVSSSIDATRKIGPFVDFTTSFFAIILPSHPISGKTIERYLKDLKPMIEKPKRKRVTRTSAKIH